MKAFNLLNILAGIASLPIAFATDWVAYNDTQCTPRWPEEFCVSVIHHHNATTTYDLTVSYSQVGWVALGFGRSMITAPMVIMWKDTSNGNTIVSQRRSRDYITPSIDPHPPRVATANDYRSASNSSSTTFSFSVPTTTETRQPVIFAWSKTPPNGNSVDANLLQHDVQGHIMLNLMVPLPDYIDVPILTLTALSPSPISISVGDGNSTTALTPSQRAFVAHGILLSLAFLVILPLGAIQARYFRTRVPGKLWFAAYWILQWPVTVSLIVSGLYLAADQIEKSHKEHLSGIHMRRGLALVSLYILQSYLGGFIKPSRATKRPPQNFAHTVLDLMIISLSFWQVYIGLDIEWPKVGRVHEVPQFVWTWWKVLMVVITIIYGASLVFIPRRDKVEAQEGKERKETTEK